jgi:pseudouridine kinase
MNIACIGALNWDRKLRLGQVLQAGTSNPVCQLAGNAGGVAFNLARHLARLGAHGAHASRVRLLSAWGDDPEGQSLQHAAQHAGVELLGLCREGQASGQYTAVLQPDGELALALADMQVLQQLPETFWALAESAVRQADAVALDLNLPAVGLQRLCVAARASGSPLALVAVSAPKMAHLPNDLRGVDLLLLNRDELGAVAQLGDLAAGDVASVWPHLQQRGLRALLLTQGADGATLCLPDGLHPQPAPERITALDVTGAGDALSATVLHAWWVQGLPLADALAQGQRAAASVLLSLDNA